jgi:hypothetical protein
VSGDGRSVIRGGYGMFYEPTRIGTLSGAITNGVFSQSFTVFQPTNAIDPGPSQGRLPTDPFLANGPTVNRALLESMFQAGATVKNAGNNVTVDNANRRDTYSHELSIGYERQLARDLSLNADYIRVAQRGILITRNLNPGVRRDTTRGGTIDRVSADFAANVNTLVNDGETNYNGLQMQLEKRFSHNWSTRVSYTLSRAEGNISADGTTGSNFQFLDDLNLDDNEGPTDFDRTHNLVVSGSFLVPKTGGLNVSWIARALSGLPFSLTDSSTDPDRNGILIDPIAAGSYSGNGPDAITVDSEGGRNGARGPNYFQLDLRGGYRIALPGGRKLEAFVDVFNVTNRANFANPIGDRRLTDFLLLTAVRDGAVPRTAQMGVRFVF